MNETVMEIPLHDPAFISIIWVGMAFFCGSMTRRTGLPAMISFLATGFILNSLGFTEGSLALDTITDMGITLLLFTIGLKLDLKSLTRPEIWAGTSIHVLFCILFFCGVIMAGAAIGLSTLTGLTFGYSLVLGFAFSCSSTVFAVNFFTRQRRNVLTNVYNIFADAGRDFAIHTCESIMPTPTKY